MKRFVKGISLVMVFTMLATLVSCSAKAVETTELTTTTTEQETATTAYK